MLNLKKIAIFAAAVMLAACHQDSIEETPASETSSSTVTTNYAARAATSGVLKALTYNVAGLPEGLSSSHPATNTPFISTKIAPYDIIHVQEDFNYHAALYANDYHPYRTPTSGGAAVGSGLNTLSNYPYTDFQRIKWNSCNGTDCLTPKGFTFMRIRIDEGVYIDFYNAHPNAGTEDADLSARRSNISQISQFITENSSGNAVVLMGDWNCRYTRAEDNIRTFTDANGLTDAWIKLVRNNNVPAAGTDALLCDSPPTSNSCEVVDKIFYRSNNLVTITPSGYQLNDPTFVNSSGEPLSDHWPLFVNINWVINSTLQASDLFGGPHGTPFNDANSLSSSSAPASISIRAGSRIDQVSIKLTNGTTLAHGGTGGTLKTLTLSAGEYVDKVTLHEGQYSGHTRIFYIEFHTNLNHTLSGGTKTGDAVTYTTPTGWKLTGYYGNAGDAVDKLGLIYNPL